MDQTRQTPSRSLWWSLFTNCHQPQQQQQQQSATERNTKHTGDPAHSVFAGAVQVPTTSRTYTATSAPSNSGFAHALPSMERSTRDHRDVVVSEPPRRQVQRWRECQRSCCCCCCWRKANTRSEAGRKQRRLHRRPRRRSTADAGDPSMTAPQSS